MSRKNTVTDSLRELRVQRLCYCSHLVPLNNNGRVFCVPKKPFPLKEDCPNCPLRLDENEVPAKLKAQVRGLSTPASKQRRPSTKPDPENKE